MDTRTSSSTAPSLLSAPAAGPAASRRAGVARRWRGYGSPPPGYSPRPSAVPRWNLSLDQLLGAAEMLISLGTRGRLSENVQSAVDGYRTLVRLWAEPHLRPGEPDAPCPGCGNARTLDQCPYRQSFRQVLGDAAAGFRAAGSPPP